MQKFAQIVERIDAIGEPRLIHAGLMPLQHVGDFVRDLEEGQIRVPVPPDQGLVDENHAAGQRGGIGTRLAQHMDAEVIRQAGTRRREHTVQRLLRIRACLTRGASLRFIQ